MRVTRRAHHRRGRIERHVLREQLREAHRRMWTRLIEENPQVQYAPIDGLKITYRGVEFFLSAE